MVCTLQSVGAGRSNYYTAVISRDDYYTEGGEASGYWLGSGADTLQLKDREIEFKDKALRALLHGKNPHDGSELRHVSLKERQITKTVIDKETGQKITRKVTQESKLAWDFTLSAPKSVSVLWSQADPTIREAIERAQKNAVEKVAEFLETNGTYTRRGKGGRSLEKVAPIFAAFPHITSRALDPQLHTHLLLLNTGLRKDGKGGAIDGRHLFQHVYTLGALYRDTLRDELEQRLGVKTRETHAGKERSFEVEGVPASLCHALSTRTREINATIREREEEGRALTGKDRKAITLATRSTKQAPSRSHLFSAWKELGEREGFTARAVIHQEPTRRRTAKTSPVHTLPHLSRTYYRASREGPSLPLWKSRYPRRGSYYEKEERRIAWEKRQKRWKFRITVKYALGLISRKTYRRLVFGEGNPKTPLGIHFAYMTYQISLKKREWLLEQVERNRDSLEKPPLLSRIRDLLRGGVINDRTARDIVEGRVSLQRIEKHFEERPKELEKRSESPRERDERSRER